MIDCSDNLCWLALRSGDEGIARFAGKLNVSTIAKVSEGSLSLYLYPCFSFDTFFRFSDSLEPPQIAGTWPSFFPACSKTQE